MVTIALMLLLVAFLAFVLLYGARFEGAEDEMASSAHFFDKDNSNAMSGFWCLIVILVHVPVAYQNGIQDAIGSFAYIGVTFFFMTSGYGLRLGLAKDPTSIRVFWRKRLPKLLVPCLVVNVFRIVFALVEGSGFSWTLLFYLPGWVEWLLVCYVLFWAVHRLVPGGGLGKTPSSVAWSWCSA